MREMKCRAWDKELKRMVVPELIHMKNKTLSASILNEPEYISVYRFDQVEFLQYTGLTSVDGEEIYEHDVVHDHEGEAYIVYWDEDWLCFIFKEVGTVTVFYTYEQMIDRGTDELKIVGDIHTQPEWLQG